MVNVLGNRCMFKMLVTSVTQGGKQSEIDLKRPLTEYKTSASWQGKKVNFHSFSFTCNNEFCLSFLFLRVSTSPSSAAWTPWSWTPGGVCGHKVSEWKNVISEWQRGDSRCVFWKDQRWGFSAGSRLQTVWRLKVCIDQPVFQLEAFQATPLLLIPTRGV